MYRGSTIKTTETADGTTCWKFSPEKYVKVAVDNVELKLTKSNHGLPLRCDTLMPNIYHPSKDVLKQMNGQGVKKYQELIGILIWAVEIRRFDILLEVSLLLSHLALPRVRHLQAVYRIFGYLKKVPKSKL